jgi:hypothetical protein
MSLEVSSEISSQFFLEEILELLKAPINNIDEIRICCTTLSITVVELIHQNMEFNSI